MLQSTLCIALQGHRSCALLWASGGVTGQSVDVAQFSGASITFPEIALGGMWEVEAQVSNIPGAIYNTFTIHGDPWKTPLGWQDEQDLVVYTSSLLTKTQYRPAAGMQMNNFDPACVPAEHASSNCVPAAALLTLTHFPLQHTKDVLDNISVLV
ncbi:hypothetical protein QFC22_002449 [Naganishia vaughanmartiniae]|uniref:Uncharacterized protein n=1 Tax=Naganishia vaughanmartiniae TaxID=1424756 RepID=A0ACC2XFK8_9TREE|nr:hypothetical protein QFC22_002449 [Naganishia vaughanmartiniae]